MLIDVLAEPVRRSSRTYDPDVHNHIVENLCRALEPALSPETPSIVVAVAGTKSVVEVQQHFVKLSEIQSEAQDDEELLPPVEIDVLGSSRVNESTGAVVVVDPTGIGGAVLELRELVRSAVALQRPVIVLNHPQQGSLYKVANCSGTLPLELLRFWPVYTMAPFALRITSDSNASLGVGRFVFMYSFPGKWQLWRVIDEKESGDGGRSSETPDTVAQLLSMASTSGPDSPQEEADTNYALITAWTSKPNEKALLAAVNRAGREDMPL